MTWLTPTQDRDAPAEREDRQSVDQLPGSSMRHLETDLGIPFAQASDNFASREFAERQFRSSDDIFHLLVNNIKDYGIIMLDVEGHIVTWNAGAQAISGYQAHEAVGKHLSIF